MEPDKNKTEKLINWKEIKLYIKLSLTFLFMIIGPVLVIIHSEKISKTINLSIESVTTMGFAIFPILGLLFIRLLESETSEHESSNSKEKNDKHFNHRIVMWFPQKTKGTIRVPSSIDLLIRDKGNTTSRTTPFPTKQDKFKRIAEDPVQKQFEKDKSNLKRILSQAQNGTCLITSDLDTGLLKAQTTCTNEFENYIRNNPLKGFTVETFDLTKDLNPPSVAPKVKTDLNNLINQIQTHSDNLSVKKDSRHLVNKATLKGDDQ